MRVLKIKFENWNFQKLFENGKNYLRMEFFKT